MARVRRDTDRVQAHMRRWASETGGAFEPLPAQTPERLSFAQMRAKVAKEFKSLEHLRDHDEALVSHEGPRLVTIGLETSQGQVIRGFMAEGAGMAQYAEQRHPDTIGVYRQPEPKSIHSKAGKSRLQWEPPKKRVLSRKEVL